MTPYRPLVIDNRAPAPVFLEGSPITDGLANLFASAINAPIAAGQIRRQREDDDRQIRRQREQDDRQQLMQDSMLARQAQQDELAQLWHGENAARQAQRDALAAEFQQAQIANMQGDNARQMAAMFGNGLNNTAARGIDAVKALGGLFKGHQAPTPARERWQIVTKAGQSYRVNLGTGETQPIDMELPAATTTPGPEAAAARLDIIRQTNPTMHAVMTQQPLPGAGVPPVQDDRPPEWRAAKIDQGGMDQWHQLAKADPATFAQHLQQLKASRDPRYPLIIAELRRRATGP